MYEKLRKRKKPSGWDSSQSAYYEASQALMHYMQNSIGNAVGDHSDNYAYYVVPQFYKSLLNFESSESFIVEPNYGKGYMEPDAFKQSH
ncbi:hypothetical protein ACN6MY_12190 [Peribacillus sp. B-H-3]|uniref:hypothetical protein n=1 Tax=Peribacillus sp. B-H-3 TaxID=3400420 RepID=UPI003B010C2A